MMDSETPIRGGYNQPESKVSYYVMLFFAAVFALDFTVYFITFYYNWIHLKGPLELYGFALASYDLTQAIFALPLGWWADKRGPKEVLFFCILVNLAGNVMYAVVNTWQLTLVSRLVGGIGSGALGLIMSFIADSVPPGPDRLLAFNEYRQWTFVSRLVGPGIGIALIYLPKFSLCPNGGCSIEVSPFTYPSWLMITLNLTCIVILCCVSFRQKKFQAMGLWELMNRQSQVFYNAFIVVLVNAFATFCYWTFYAQLVPIAEGEFNVVDYRNIWKVYIPVGVGFLLSTILIKRIPRDRLPSEFKLAVFGVFVMIGGHFFFFHYGDKPSAEWRLYGGTGVISFGLNFIGSSLTAFYSDVVDAVPQNLSTMMSFFLMVGALSRFGGPFWSSLLLHKDGAKLKGINLVFGLNVLLLGICMVIIFLLLKPVFNRVKDEQRRAQVKAEGLNQMPYQQGALQEYL